MKLRFLICALMALFASGVTMAQSQESRWVMNDDGSISWNVPQKKIPHYDHIEMSGEKVSVVYRYGVRPDGS